MPKGLILLLLLLLIGGYFILMSGQGSGSESIPSVSSSTDVALSGKQLVISVNSKILLPEHKKYEIKSAEVTLISDGTVIDKKSFSGGNVEGPGEYPLSCIFKSDIADEYSVKIRADVMYDNKELNIDVSSPILIPLSSIVRSPTVSVYLKSLSLFGDEKKAEFSVSLRNENEFNVGLNGFSISVNGESVSVDAPSILSPGEEKVFEFFKYVSGSDVNINVSGTFTYRGVTRNFSENFSMSLPDVNAEPLRVFVSAKPKAVSPSKYTFTVEGKVFNPNAFPVDANIDLRVRKGNIYQKYSLFSGLVPPSEEENFSKDVDLIDDLSSSEGVISISYLGREYNAVGFPIHIVDFLDVLDTPSFEVNTYKDGNNFIFVSLFPGSDDARVRNLHIQVKNINKNDDEVISKDYGEFNGEVNIKEVFSGSKIDVNDNVEILVSGEYGILGLWVPFKITFRRTGWG